MVKNVLILGCGRSGTSIFGELFQDSGYFQYYSEPYIEDIYAMEMALPVALKVPRSRSQHNIMPGLSLDISNFVEHFKEVEIYWIIRHPLDAICSLKVGISRNWGHHPRPKDWEQWKSRSLVARCAYHWAYINQLGYNQVKHVVSIKYFEEMLEDPKDFATRIFNDLNLDVNVAGIQYWTNRVRKENDAQFIEAETSKPYSLDFKGSKIDRWKAMLTKEELEEVIPIIHEVATSFGYRLPEI